jgi:hypothetical protein
MAEHRDIDVVLGKTFSVLLEAERVKPIRNFGSEMTPWSGGIEARIGLRMMPTFPRSSLSFRTAGFPQYGWKAGISGGTFPKRQSA